MKDREAWPAAVHWVTKSDRVTEQQIWSEDSFWESFPQILKQGGCMMKTSKGTASFLRPSKPFPMTSHAWNPEFVWLTEENEITQCPE